MRTIEDLDELTELATTGPAVFVRYSVGPDADAEGPSWDYEAGVQLPGLPVSVLRPESWWTRPAVDWVARRVCKYLDLARKAPDRRPWVLAGRVVGNGPDHEPLVQDVEPIAWLAPAAVEQAQKIYHERFDVGRDSTGRH
ncbi:MAG: Uncharacterized protein JWO57_3754 [Pseudonocardiales bacterium]|nr:Uncharacterized protein [Pseudonocardiales bacterium]